MSVVKSILVVDDHFDVLEFLQSMLELSSEHYDVMAVPSAEEGLLELRQKKFDLLITDVRLPGMSGFDLVRQLHRFKPDMPAIMITGYSSEQGKREAAELGVYRYFEKPLDTDEVLTAVHLALYGDLMVLADGPEEATAADLVIPRDVSRRLETLRADTSATRLALATMTGQILVQVGRGYGFNLPTLASLMARNMENSFLLAKELGGETPTTIQYHAGDRTEVYIANVGRGYFLALFFDAQTRRGRMGTIWVFAQRAIKDLLEMLPPFEAGAEMAQKTTFSPPESTQAVTDTGRVDPAPVPETPLSTSEAAADRAEATEPPTKSAGKPDLATELAAPTEADGFFTLAEGVSEEPDELDAFWNQAVMAEGATAEESDSLSFEAAQGQGLLPAEMENVPEAADPDGKRSLEPLPDGREDLLVLAEAQAGEAVDLDEFWDAAATDETSATKPASALSLEEARRQGLIQGELAQTLQSNEHGAEAPPPAESTAAKEEVPPFLEGSYESVDVEAFWSQALADEVTNGDTTTDGLSFEEAKRKGLISDEMDVDESAD